MKYARFLGRVGNIRNPSERKLHHYPAHATLAELASSGNNLEVVESIALGKANVRRKALEPIRQASDREHEKPLTQTVRVAVGDSVPPGYRRFPVKSPAIYAKAQVLSSKLGVPVFLETPSDDSRRRIAYWVHESILPDLARWLRVRIFPISEIVNRDT